jgi:hypothetical protein
MINVVPSCSLVFILMVPPCAFTVSLVIFKPRPVPGTPFFVWIVRFGRHPSEILLSDKLNPDPEPHKTAAVLQDGINGVLRKAVVDGEMAEG